MDLELKKNFKKLGQVENTPNIFYVKYRNEQSKEKALRVLVNEEEVAKATTIKEVRVEIRSVTMEHCFENEETH